MGASNRIAVVTGAGSGSGRQVAIALLRGQYCVALAGRRREALEAVARSNDSFQSRALVVPTDVQYPSSVEALFAATRKPFGRLDLLFNNAGISGPAVPLEELTYEGWMSVLGTNLTGVFLCIREAFRLMKDQTLRGGRIINNGSVSAYSPRPNSAPYTATKHAITGLTKSVSLHGRKYDVACGQFDIGSAATDMTKRMEHSVPQADGRTMIEPTMDADDVVRAVVYMASLPLTSNVQFMTVMATKMPFVGRG